MSAGGKGTETDIQWDIGDCTFFLQKITDLLKIIKTVY